MIAELGHFTLILALCIATLQGVLGIAGGQRNSALMMHMTRQAALVQFACVAVGFGILVHAFVTLDFSLTYVVSNANSTLPVFYRVLAVWSAHEGSLLLWTLILALWTIAVALGSRRLPAQMLSRVLGAMGFLNVGFLSFMVFTSNPFLRQVAAVDGADMNPLLQDVAQAIHPPMLYIGYVGFSVAFAFAIAAMLEGRLTREWARFVRPWTTLAWTFLTVGIALGSWWAYYELGWGGWWFWDPVENASFMPWLLGTALIHSLAVTEARGLFKSWTLLLAISAFSLSLLGTFMVRSGILVSVHAFASDPTRGYFILTFLALVIGSALALYIWRAPSMDSPGGFKALSRETFLLLNNVLLVIATVLILFGTLYPLFIDAMNYGKVSVGPPWFNIAFLLPALPLAFLIGVAMHLGWRSTRGESLKSVLALPAIAAAVCGALLPWLVYGRLSPLIFIGTTAAFWIVFSALREPLSRLTGRSTTRLSRAALGMYLAHIGVGVFVLGVTVVSSFSIELDRSVLPGGNIEIAGMRLHLNRLRSVEGPNYEAEEALFELRDGDGRTTAVLAPQKRIYNVRQSPMTEAGIDARWYRDLFVAMGEPLGNGAWSIRAQYKPMLRLVWLGAVIMALGGILALTDRRYFRREEAVA